MRKPVFFDTIAVKLPAIKNEVRKKKRGMNYFGLMFRFIWAGSARIARGFATTIRRVRLYVSGPTHRTDLIAIVDGNESATDRCLKSALRFYDVEFSVDTTENQSSNTALFVGNYGIKICSYAQMIKCMGETKECHDLSVRKKVHIQQTHFYTLNIRFEALLQTMKSLEVIHATPGENANENVSIAFEIIETELRGILSDVEEELDLSYRGWLSNSKTPTYVDVLWHTTLTATSAQRLRGWVLQDYPEIRGFLARMSLILSVDTEDDAGEGDDTGPGIDLGTGGTGTDSSVPTRWPAFERELYFVGDQDPNDFSILQRAVTTSSIEEQD